ncbi:metallophosphoesterase family protein [Chengkuizengella axinellae]|uniref:Metallophosphoesterase family protein n=1 Tax=Chengkuizengella axinellae TaxID=3064388 RepID=A0ABT9IZX9_9BACL|nr:metallophosphoesterase [Chengkuizengella sp. 2205SS18-9]MDP5274939.1 metallophosphoesterase family protein [Chengkuizengella sp. 2205SS18-9]
MKFAVIADIHGNATALRAVLNEIDNKKETEHIFCLGDMIAIGPDSNEVLEILFSREDVSMITENHDEAVLALLKGEEHPESHSHAREHHLWIGERIDKRFIPKLEKLRRSCL